MHLTKVVTVETRNSSPEPALPDLAAMSRAFKPPYEMSVTILMTRIGRKTIEWPIRWTVLRGNFLFMVCIAKFVRSSIELNGWICSIRMSNSGTSACSKTSLTAFQVPLRCGLSEKPWMRTTGYSMTRAKDVWLENIHDKPSSKHSRALIGCNEQNNVAIGWEEFKIPIQ